jgi:hypothetical protein
MKLLHIEKESVGCGADNIQLGNYGLLRLRSTDYYLDGARKGPEAASDQCVKRGRVDHPPRQLGQAMPTHRPPERCAWY